MIISGEKKFVFIKTMKTAGSSIEIFLGKHCEDHAIVTPQWPRVSDHEERNMQGFYSHCFAADIADWMGANIWPKFFKFCVERNPWEKTISLYMMRKYHGELNSDSIDAFLDFGIFPLNYPIYTSLENHSEIIVDRVLKYENLEDELKDVFEILGIPYSGDLGVRAKGEYRSNRLPAHKLLTPAQYNKIGDIFAHEISLHGWYS